MAPSLSIPRFPITVTAPTQAAVAVVVYQADGSTQQTAFTTEGGASSPTWPDTVAAGTTTVYWVPADRYVISAKVGGVEVAGGYGSTKTQRVDGYSTLIAPNFSGLGLGTAVEQAINAQTGATYTLVAGDAGKLVTLSNAGAVTLTVPQDSAVAIAVGSYVDLYQLGAGQVTVAAGPGATLRVSGLTAKARAQYSRLVVQKVSASTWVVAGDLAAS